MRVETAGGQTFELGTTETNPTIGIVDYSRRETDDFGVTTVVERGFARTMSVRLGVPFLEVDAFQRRLVDLRATPAKWIADDRFGSLAFDGFYKSFDLDLAIPPLSYCTLQVEGLTEAAPIADAGGDPAVDGASTLQLLQPVTVTDAVLVSASVPENDHPVWSAAMIYPAGAKVIRASRRYESVAAANLAHDPAAGEGQWLDIGPTNRWAMFDQALGTVTQATGPVTVTLKPGAASGLALLDVDADTVRVQAPGYDRTQVVIAGQAVTFLDLTVAAGANVTVTVARGGVTSPGTWNDAGSWSDTSSWSDTVATGGGSGIVAIGTLLVGSVVRLGVTEASPTAGIIDYSRKDVDDFGAVTVVQRAWAKRMAAKALIRTDAVDLVAGRITAVRARPALWIGLDGLDSLTVYGFFKEFSIEVGETTSKLSLSIEGLSKAPPKPSGLLGSVAWPDVLDPDGTKPTDNADKTSEHTSADTAAVGGVPSTQVLSDLTQAQQIAAAQKTRVDTLNNLTIPAINQAIDGANANIVAAQGAAAVAQTKATQAQGLATTAKTNADAALANIVSEAGRLDQRIDTVAASGGYDDAAVYTEISRVDGTAISRDAALSQSVQTVSAAITTTDTSLRALVQTKEQAAVDRETAISQRIDTIVAESGDGDTDVFARSEVTRVEQAAISRDDALGTRIDTTSASIGPAINAKAQEVTTAFATADTALGSRIDTVSASISPAINAKAQEITTAFTSADTALAGRTTVLEATARGGGNLSPNSSLTTLDGWLFSFNADNASSVGLNGAGAYWQIGGVENNLTLHRSAAGAGLCSEAQGPIFAVRPGGWYQVYALTASHRSNAWVSLFFYDANGVFVGYAGENLNTVINAGGQNINAHEVVGNKCYQAPPTAVQARVALRQYNVTSDGYAWFSRPFVAEVQQGCSTWAPYSASNDRPVAAALTARLSTVETATTDGRFATAQRASTLEARADAIDGKLSGTAPSGLSARINTVEVATTDGRFATAQRASSIEAAAGQLAARVANTETATTDGRFAAASTVNTLQSDYNGTKATVTQQAGTIAGLGSRTAAYVRLVTVAGNNRAQLTLSADANGSAGVDIVGDVSISGNLLVSGSVATGQIATNAVTGLTSAQSASARAVPYATAYGNATDGLSATISTPSGAPVRIDFTTIASTPIQPQGGYGYPGGVQPNGYFRLVRKQSGTTTVIVDWTFAFGIYAPVSISLDTPAAGPSVSYFLQYTTDSTTQTGTYNVTQEKLFLTEIKR